MTTQAVCAIGGIVMALALTALVHLRPTQVDLDDGAGGAPWFVWAVGVVLFLVMCGLFTHAGLR